MARPHSLGHGVQASSTINYVALRDEDAERAYKQSQKVLNAGASPAPASASAQNKPKFGILQKVGQKTNKKPGKKPAKASTKPSNPKAGKRFTGLVVLVCIIELALAAFYFVRHFTGMSFSIPFTVIQGFVFVPTLLFFISFLPGIRRAKPNAVALAVWPITIYMAICIALNMMLHNYFVARVFGISVSAFAVVMIILVIFVPPVRRLFGGETA